MGRPFLQFVTGSDVEDLQKRLAAAIKGTDLSVQRCTGIDDATRAAWGAFYGAVLQYTQEAASTWHAAAQMNRGESYEDELVTWQDKLNGPCQLDVPLYKPKESDAAAALVSTIKWLSIGAIAIGGAVVVSKVVEVIPHIGTINIGKKKEPEKKPAVAERRRRR